MREYKTKISLSKNDRGVWSLDPSIGCESGMKLNSKGCYNDCYAARYSKKYGYDFGKTVFRFFESREHLEEIRRKIDKIDMPFIRMGTSGDPSENWEHTLDICSNILNRPQLRLFDVYDKEIVIITKHWNNLSDAQLQRLSSMNICINTSVSAIDDKDMLYNSIAQYFKLKKYCKSILRVVTFDFNTDSKDGLMYYNIQKELLKTPNIIDTVFRCSPSNPLVTNGIIKIKKTKFMGKKCYVSKFNKKTYFGKCGTCIEMCGAKMTKN